MPKRKNDPHMQPNLLAEPQAEYQPTPELLAEKEHYRQRLAEHLKDPAFRQMEGFPIGEDEAILALSDPPYYTACPNPFMGEIIERWQQERQALRKELGLPDDSRENGFQTYHREPFAADVSEGKNDPIYNAHSYHTKVPHKAIMRYILHYTEPGDIVFDGFCGTGMTGIAAQLCGDKKTIESLGYSVKKDGQVLDEKENTATRLGARKAVMVDLSPIATFIAYNYNTPINTDDFERSARKILLEVAELCGWMYETLHTDGKSKGKINYTVWSEVLACPNCIHEIVFSTEAMDQESGHLKEKFDCPHCGAEQTKDKLELLFDTVLDPTTGQATRQPRRRPILIEYKIGENKFQKKPDEIDLEVIKRINSLSFPVEIPLLQLPDMQMRRVGRMKTTGVSYIRHFFLPRQAHSLAILWREACKQRDRRLRNFLLFFVEQAIWGMSVLNRYQPIMHGRLGGSQVNRALSGVFYVASQISEVSPWYNLEGKLGRLVKAFHTQRPASTTSAISTEDLAHFPHRENSIDYIFTDPPFGENIYYSDLNLLVESWHGVRTATTTEAIVDRVKGKKLADYQNLMSACFKAYYRVLKYGHWMTVEFHNSQNSVWNAIQEAILQAGFMVADVRTLDKQQGTFQQVTTTSAVKQDLVISAYKPAVSFERQFKAEAGSIQGAWAFIRQHLEQLPSPTINTGVVSNLTERQPYLLYDRMVAFHLVRGLSVPLSSPEFYQGLAQRFLEREGMYFTPAQAAEYDKLRLKAERVEQLALFVTDEKSAVQWLRQVLDPSLGGETQTYQDLQPKFIQQLHQARHEKLPELRQMLEENFLQDEAERWYSPNPDRKADLEALRQRTLLREYKEYLKGKGRLKIFRSEAVRAGFSADWKERNYADIVQIAERLPESVLQEDQGLLMYYHNASLRLSEKPKQERFF